MRTESNWEERSSSFLQTVWNEGRDILINGVNKYLNFGSTSGSSGYGFRDNGGTMQVKNSGGSWSNFTSGGAGTGDMLAATYDPQAIAGDAFDQDNMTDGTTNKNYTATEKTKLAGIATGATENSKATGAELDTATDDAKFATAKALKDSHNVPSVAPSTAGKLMRSDGTDWTSASVTTADITASTNKNYVTDAQQTVIGNTSGTNTGDQTNITGNAATVTTNANLTGPITSVGNATSIASQTGTGTKFVVDTSPTLVTPNIGVATATTINKVALTVPATGSTLTIADGKTFTVNQTLTLTGTTGTTMTFPSTSATIARTDAANTFTGIQTMTSPATTTSITTGSTSFTAWAGATTLLTFGGTGSSASTFMPSTLDTTSSITGAIRTSGGISAAKGMWAGTFVVVGTQLELGHATDTTLSRVASGIIAVEGETLNGYTTTATAAGTTTLTITATKTQFFTGSSTQTVKLPTTSVIVGQPYIIVNNSTGLVTVQSSGANTIQILGAGMSATFTAIVATPTTAANWNCILVSSKGLNNAITASSNAATIDLAYVTNTVTNNSAATLTITLPTAGAIDGEMRVIRVLDATAVAQTLTLVNTENSSVTPNATTNGSTTLPYTFGAQYNGATSKWRITASA